MSYAPRRDQVQEIVINKLCHGQLMIEKHYYKYGTMSASAPGSSATLLSNFRTAYRTNILGFTSTSVRVTSYVMQEVTGARVVITSPGPPAKRRFVITYDPSKKERFYGTGDVNDQGTSALASELPLHEAMGAFKRPAVLRRGYHEGNYTRYGPFSESQHDDTKPEEWTQAVLDQVNPLLESMRVSVLQDTAPPEIGWFLATFSPGYWADVWSDTNPENSWGAAETLSDWIATRFVRTQVSRRFTTAGVIEGK